MQVFNFTLTLGGTSAVPSSTRVRLIGDSATWTVYINKTCSDTFYHWTTDTDELTNCVVYVSEFVLLFGGVEKCPLDHYVYAIVHNVIYVQPFRNTCSLSVVSCCINNAHL